MSLSISYRSVQAQQRAKDAYLDNLNLASQIETNSRFTQNRALAIRNSSGALSSTDAILDPNLRPIPIKRPKESLTEDEIAVELAKKLRPYMLNNNEVVRFIEDLKATVRLFNFSDLFDLFAASTLTGITRIDAVGMDNLYNIFLARKLAVPAAAAAAVPVAPAAPAVGAPPLPAGLAGGPAVPVVVAPAVAPGGVPAIGAPPLPAGLGGAPAVAPGIGGPALVPGISPFLAGKAVPSSLFASPASSAPPPPPPSGPPPPPSRRGVAPRAGRSSSSSGPAPGRAASSTPGSSSASPSPLPSGPLPSGPLPSGLAPLSKADKARNDALKWPNPLSAFVVDDSVVDGKEFTPQRDLVVKTGYPCQRCKKGSNE